MKRKSQRDPLVLLETFQRNVLQKKPLIQDMITEVRMMKFKVKPVQGDFSNVNFKNTEFIEILWSLGKLDEFFQAQYAQVKEEDRGAFFAYFESLQKKFQEELNRLNLRHEVQPGKMAVLEMEIFKERRRNKRSN